MAWDYTELSGLVLLEKVIEFQRRNPDTSTWNFSSLENDQRDYVRLKQVMALLKHFAPECHRPDQPAESIQLFLHGSFLNQRSTEAYKPVFDEMDAVSKASKFHMEKYSEWEIHDLHHHYSWLVNFKKCSSAVLDFNSGIAEISYPYLYSVIITEDIINALRKEMNQADQFLWSLIDLDKRIYPWQDMVDKYGYPDDDLDDIDMDFW